MFQVYTVRDCFAIFLKSAILYFIRFINIFIEDCDFNAKHQSCGCYVNNSFSITCVTLLFKKKSLVLALQRPTGPQKYDHPLPKNILIYFLQKFQIIINFEKLKIFII